MSTRTGHLRKDDKVCWKWGQYEAYGKIQEVFTRKITRTISGKEITRNATEEEPAYLIVQEDGQEVLKSESELKLLR